MRLFRGLLAFAFAGVLSVCLLCVCLLSANAAGSLSPSRILVISSYDYSYTTVPNQLSGFAEGLGRLPVDIDYEFMDAKNFYKSADIAEFYKYLSYKLGHSDPFDLVVLMDDTSLHFGMNYKDELFADAPVVFMGVNNRTDAITAAARSGVTGIAEVIDFENNIDLARKLFPQRPKFVAIIDNTNTSMGEYVEFQKFAEAHPEIDYRTINMSYYSQNGLMEAFSEIEDDSVILYFDCIEDGDGNLYTMDSAIALITENAPSIPIWRFTIADAGNGSFGGLTYSYSAAGKIAGETAAKILTGTNASDIPLITDAVTVGYFDQNELDQFGISIRELPPDSIIINEHETFAKFYRENTLMMNLIFLIILLMIAVIALLFAANRKREKIIRQDFLTKMPNRTFITEKIAAVTESGDAFGLVMIDVDKFKTINDTLGHLVGDELLIGVAKRLKSLPKEDIVVARIGGDEFMGLIHNADHKKADRLCREITKIMRPDFESSSGALHITVSIGCATYPADTSQATSLMGLADEALYDVKEHGRNGYRLYSQLHKDDAVKDA